MNPANPNVAASVRARLLNVAKAQRVDFNQVLVRFALERILYRMTQSQHADHLGNPADQRCAKLGQP
jgi:hypothetical protein